MQISLVIPLLNEEESLPELLQWIKKVMTNNDFSWEAIFVDDGSTDSSWKIISGFCKSNDNIIGIKFKRNYGKSAALNEGFIAASGDVVITMDADMQDSPDEIPELYNMIINEGYDIVSGWKKQRHDPFIKRSTSKFYNWVTRRASKIKLHDFNCGLKAYKNEVVKNIEVYGEMHRYVPLIAQKAGYNKIGEKVVQHQARKYGKTKFGMSRFINGFLDLMTISFINRYGKNPMHLFGALGALIFFLGFVIFLWLVIQRFFFAGYGMTDRPLFFVGLLCMVLGFQSFSVGFTGELITRNSPNKNDYNVSEKLNCKE
ncbi:glycosyltransferase family 2 protein [Bacteroidales bacterium OttesenSCG-928-K03]|nr:glycosyltransferase family 2 protein [Odoribacter sp. OttesenSCG-928-L07]MDL2242691.1 glycosyltransferase family 2 protein [Bacteroidales bacterium OttesenSCG-928-K03]